MITTKKTNTKILSSRYHHKKIQIFMIFISIKIEKYHERKANRQSKINGL